MLHQEFALDDNGKYNVAIIDCRGLPDPEGLGIGVNGTVTDVQSWVTDGAPEQTKELLSIALEESQNPEVDIIAFGCLAGKNRSVAMAECFAKILDERGEEYQLEHRALHFW